MPNQPPPIALVAIDAPKRTKPSNYPEPFASQMQGRTRLSSGMCAGFKAGTGNGHRLLNETSEAVVYSNDMAPTIVRDGQFRLFFFSREEARIHVHVAHVDGEAKFWLTPQVALANHTGLSATQLRQAQEVVNSHLKEIQDAWTHHFGG